MRILWITSRLLPDACRALGCIEEVVGGWMQAQLDALLRYFGNEHDFFILSSDSRECDIQLGKVHHRSFGYGAVTYGAYVPSNIELIAQSSIKEFNPDIIHIHGTEFFYGRMAREVYGDKPVVVSIQGILNACHSHVNGGLSRDEVFWQQFNVRRFLFGATIFNEQSYWRKERVPQERRIFENNRFFIGRTMWDQAWTKALNPSAKYFHVNETLRDAFYLGKRRSRATIRPHSIYCSAAAGYPLKGAHILIRAIAFLKDKYPDISLRICAAERVGCKNSLITLLKADQYSSYLRFLIHKLEVQDHVVCLPALTADMVAEELLRAETFVLPSFCENSPNSLGEAQLVGTPAIATFVGGTPSVLRDGVDGRLVPAGDPAALAGMIDWYFSHPSEVDAYSVSAMAAALSRHDPKSNAQATIRTYREIIECSVTTSNR